MFFVFYVRYSNVRHCLTRLSSNKKRNVTTHEIEPKLLVVVNFIMQTPYHLR